MGMTREEAKAFLTDISYDLGTVGMEYLSVKDGEKMREAIETLEQEPRKGHWLTHKEYCDKNKRAGISGRVFPHRIRHTTATDALRRGMAIEQVQQLLGHERIATTLEYAKISREDVKEKHSRYII